jgi:hypothetical protein
VEIDRTGWSGDGDFTIQLLEALDQVPEVAFVRVEDAPASRAGTGYNLLANELYVRFATEPRPQVERWLGIILRRRSVEVPRLSMDGLAARLAQADGIGEADYADEHMLQFLRTERIVQPYQTRGYKLVELVRLYEACRAPQRRD